MRNTERILNHAKNDKHREHDEHADDAPHDVALAELAFVGLVGVDDEFDYAIEEEQERHGEHKYDERVDDVLIDPADESGDRCRLCCGVGGVDAEIIHDRHSIKQNRRPAKPGACLKTTRT